MTMSYIIFVNPAILSQAGIPAAPVMGATALAAAIMTISMGLFTNYPFALASGMGLNAVVTFGIVLGMKLPWQTAMGMIFWEGIIITLLVLTNVREAVMDAIPMPLKQAIGVGIGLFIAFIGLKEAGFVVASPDTLVKLGDFHQMPVLVAAIGLVITAFMVAWGVRGAILLGIVLTTVVAIPLGVAKMPTKILTTAIDLSTVGQLDILGALRWALVPTIFALLITDFFDTMGTVIAVGGEGGLLRNGKLPRLKGVLLVDSLAAVVGGLFGASSVTTYVESAAGVAAGGRSGLTSVVAGLLFLLALPFTPIAGIVPAAATAPALIVVGFLMMQVVREIPWTDVEKALPAFLTIIGIPLTYSISYGIGFGFISYTLIQVLRGHFRDVHWLMYVASILFAMNFLLPH
ncbi:MAG: NCS2 family permease [Firmicutes bacterium]|nr:NCS2 family permease [Bacillota bacterium]